MPYHPPRMTTIVMPILAAGALVYAVVATGVMKPRGEHVAPLSAPPGRPFGKTIAAVGLVEPASEIIEVGARVPGWIDQVFVAAGAAVRAGDPLWSVDSLDLRSEVELREIGLSVAEAKLTRLRAMPRPEDVPIARAALREAESRVADARNNLEFIERVADRRAVREDEVSQRREALAAAEARAAQAHAELDRLLAGAWMQDILVAERETAEARALVERAQADLERLTTRSPIDGVVLRVGAKVGGRAGSEGGEPLMVLGSPPPLHARVDINEQDIPRVKPGKGAVAFARGAGGEPQMMTFVRLDPYVVPKRSLSGDARERVDTRVLQAIYRFDRADAAVYVGQQLDIYIEE